MSHKNEIDLLKIYQDRRHRLRQILEREGLDALIVSLDANRFYLSGFELKDSQTDESSGCLIITSDGKDWLCTDPRYHEAACRLWDENQVFIYRAAPAETIGKLLKETMPGKKIAFDPRHMPVSFFTDMGLKLIPKVNLVEELRVIKDQWEIEAISKSCALNEKMMKWLPSVLIPGKSEAELAWEIEQYFRNGGAEGLAFSSIVAVDGNAALPHAVPGTTKLKENCAVLVDVGCRLKDYNSDQTRSFWVGDKVDEFFADNLKKVQEAQAKAIEAIAPGVTGEEVYNVAYASLEKNKVAEYFTHGLGHGVGLQTHESPRLSRNINYPLKPGMVVTVEPGVYYPGRLGIRWEHMILVTEDSYKII